MAELREIWDQLVSYLADGISVIPIRDKDEEVEGKKLNRKSPYPKWAKYQNSIMTKEELWFLLERYNTTAIATICGRVSGNMEAIDIDVKWFPGIDKLLFDEIKLLAPDLLKRLRIVKTPSGGWHLLYRVEVGFIIPGNRKIASRQSSDEELSQNPKEKNKCFIETRGEGGYVAAPPGLHYEIKQENPLPVLTISERELLFNICSSFNQILKEESVKAPSQDSFYYDENPFESYNKSSVGERTLEQHGWTFHSETDQFIYFSRPGSKSKDLHAAFMKASRLYRFFTTNSEFDVDRSYKPATVRGKLEFNGNMKLLHVKLVTEGHGIIKKEVEKKLVNSAAVGGYDLPANVSDLAKESYKTIREQVIIKMPYGIFWQPTERDGIEIIRETFLVAAEGLGFRLYNGDLRRIEGKLLNKVTEREYFDTMKKYIQIEDSDEYIKVCSSFELFIQKSGEFMAGRSRMIEAADLLLDTKDVCYKFYLNGYLKIDTNGLGLCLYDQLNGLLILGEKIQNRDFVSGKIQGKYLDFLRLACRYETNTEYLNSIIGYLAHEYKDETTPYIIVLTEECADPKDGGGSGKNVFCNLFLNTTTVFDVPGSQVKYDEKFLQAWGGERLYVISDVDKNFNYGFLKNLSGGKGKKKNLYIDEMSIEVEDMPKFVIQTNFGINKVDGGIERRIRQIEFTDFFTKAKGIDVYFGCFFPNGWNEQDWIGYDNFIANCIQDWIKKGRKLDKIGISENGFIKQFDQVYNENTRQFIEEYWPVWKDGIEISLEDFNKLYTKFCIENRVKEIYTIKNTKMNKALEEWCIEHKCLFQASIPTTRNGLSVRLKAIIPQAPF